MHPGEALENWYADTDGRDEPDHLQAIAAELDDIATRLSPLEWPLVASDPVSGALRRFAIATRRLAEAERTWFHPGDNPHLELMPDSELDPRMRLLEVDVFSMFVFGDLVLDAVSVDQLEWRQGATAPWVSFVNYLDDHPDPMFVSVARELQIGLRNGRNLLVFHPGPRAGIGFGMDIRGSVSLVSMARHGDHLQNYEKAGQLLHEIADELQFPCDPEWQYVQMSGVLTLAGQMTRSQRERVETAMRLGGYLTIPMAAVASLVRNLARAHEATLVARAAAAPQG